MRQTPRRFIPFALVLLLAADGCEDFRECTVPSAVVAQLPRRLSDTGLYGDIGAGTLSTGIRPFTPRFPLWSDGASKRRFILLPEDTRIDTSDMDDWQFPTGTKLWKEFTRDGIRVETRLEQKVGERSADWALVSYVWNEDETDAVRADDGAHDARGTPHDVPRAADCMGCHGGRKSRVLGFSALQLTASGASENQLAELVDADLLSDPPFEAFDIPGTPDQVAGLGYLHANCGHCHNQIRPESNGPRCYDPDQNFEFLLRIDDLHDVDATSTVRTAVGRVIDTDDVEHSQVLRRMRVRDPDLPSMPPLGTETVDPSGVASVRTLIRSLSADRRDR